MSSPSALRVLVVLMLPPAEDVLIMMSSESLWLEMRAVSCDVFLKLGLIAQTSRQRLAARWFAVLIYLSRLVGSNWMMIR